MEVDQMVGVVRQLVAQHQGLIHMDEILTAVVQAEDRVKLATQAVAAQEEILNSKRNQIEGLAAVGAAKALELESQLQAIRETDQHLFLSQHEEQEANRIALEGSISALLQQESEAKMRVQTLQADVQTYTKYKEAALEEYQRVKLALTNLTASIQV